MQPIKSTWPVALLLQLANGQLFTINCASSTVQRSDPIVSPGIASSHVHTVSGGTGFQRTMSATTAQNGKATTCDKILDRSDYWVPQLYHIRSDGLFEIVNFQESVGPSAPRLPLCWLNSILQAVYYLNRACDYVPGLTACYYSKFPKAPPAGLRMVAGNPALR
jgi:hypothetical protein